MTLILYERERRELGSFYRQPRGASASLLSHRRSRPAQVPRVGGGGRGEAEGPVPRGAVRGPRSGLAAPAPLGALPAPAFRVRLRGPRRAGPRRAAGGGTAAARGAAGRRAGRGRPGGMEAGREGRRQGGGRTWRRRREPGPAPGRGLPRSAGREPGPLPPLVRGPSAAAGRAAGRRLGPVRPAVSAGGWWPRGEGAALESWELRLGCVSCSYRCTCVPRGSVCSALKAGGRSLVRFSAFRLFFRLLPKAGTDPVHADAPITWQRLHGSSPGTLQFCACPFGAWSPAQCASSPCSAFPRGR